MLSAWWTSDTTSEVSSGTPVCQCIRERAGSFCALCKGIVICVYVKGLSPYTSTVCNLRYKVLCAKCCTVEPLYSGHHWGPMQLPVQYREVSLIQRQICTLLYVVGTAVSVLSREVSLIQSVLCRGSLYSQCATHILTFSSLS